MYYKVKLANGKFVYFPTTELVPESPSTNFKKRLFQINEQIIPSDAQAVDWEMIEDEEVPKK